MGRIKVKDHSLLQSNSFRFYTNLGLCLLLCPEKGTDQGTEILVLTHKDQGEPGIKHTGLSLQMEI